MTTITLSSATRGSQVALTAFEATKSQSTSNITITWSEKIEWTDGAVIVSGAKDVAARIAQLAPSVHLSGRDENEHAQVARWIETSSNALSSTDFKIVSTLLDQLNEHLKLRSYIVGYQLTLADLFVVDDLRNSPIWKKLLLNKANQDVYVNVVRWQSFIESNPHFQAAAEILQSQVTAEKEQQKKKKDQGSMDIELIGAEQGKVVTRFPPEPSGYLHIGHAKAALLNEYFARAYNGKLILRFDDTNPSKEKAEYEHAITEDLALLEIKPDQITYTSDWFPKLLELAWELIRRGKAYVDDTVKEEMRAQRMDGIASKNRDLSVDENLRRFQEMVDFTEFGKKCCLRAKISVDAANKAMRDPVIYRCNDTPHNRTGTQYKLYPTYDFACPIVDSLEGVTHALRTNEYRDRDDQFYWFVDALELRKPHIWDYSRLNFVYTLLSKRKLTWFVDRHIVTGWDDPRFPTIRGILRRGLSVESLKEYILMQGASKNVLMLEWDKLWAVNRKNLDNTAARHTGIDEATKVLWTLSNGPAQPESKELAKHKKNPDVGLKTTWFSSQIYIEGQDANELQVDEEVTLMDWGNAIVRKLQRNAEGKVTAIEGELHLEGDFKKTKKKLTWLSSDKFVHATLLDFDYLIIKKKIEEDENFEDFLNPVTEFKTPALVDENLSTLRKGEVIQLERRGFYICDQPLSSGSLHLIVIPDGKTRPAGATQLPADTKEAPKEKQKAAAKPATTKPAAAAAPAAVAKPAAVAPAAVKPAPAKSTAAPAVPASKPIIYTIKPLYDLSVPIDVVAASAGMYIVKPAYIDNAQA